MADLKQMCERAGFKAVRTYIVSGNVVHKSMAEAERYCKAADQKIMVDRAIARTTTYPPTNQSYPTGQKGMNPQEPKAAVAVAPGGNAKRGRAKRAPGSRL